MKLLVSALEHSANIHLHYLLKELKDDVDIIGIFDKDLGNSIIDLQATSIMGFVDALKKLPFFFKLKNQMLSLADEADKVLLIDSSGFNLPLAKAIRKRYPEKEILYYILPQAWAWKKKRIPVLEHTISKLCSILPFEPSYYSKNAPIEYVGHPLLDEIEYRKPNTVPTHVVTFMPGSRPGEIKRLIPIFKAVAQKINGVEKKIVIPNHFSQEQIEELYGDLSGFTITHEAHKTLSESDFAFICSGTATLEATLIGTPFALAYIAKGLDYAIAKRLVKIKYVGLSNILFEHAYQSFIHPEFIQEDVTVETLYNAYLTFDREAFFNNAQKLREVLKHGSAKRISQIIKG